MYISLDTEVQFFFLIVIINRGSVTQTQKVINN